MRIRQSRSINKNSGHGFTIVELLIVIVIIGILAAITIVAYNGIQQRARSSSASSALAQATKKLAVYQVDNSSYPATGSLSAAGVSDGQDVTYQYTGSGSSFCLTATNGNVSYKATEASSPTAGGCPGHGQGGVSAVSNLITNPSAENDVSGMGPNTASPTIIRSNAQTKFGAYSYALTSTTVSPDVASVISPAVQPGIYTLSYYYFTPVSRSVYFDECNSTSGGCTSQSGLQTVSANTWTRIVSTFTISGTGSQSLAIYLHGTNGPNSSGNTVYIDGLMLTAGPSTYNYSDGSSTNWTWNGTVNNSTSTGPPQ